MRGCHKNGLRDSWSKLRTPQRVFNCLGSHSEELVGIASLIRFSDGREPHSELEKWKLHLISDSLDVREIRARSIIKRWNWIYLEAKRVINLSLPKNLEYHQRYFSRWSCVGA